MLKITDLHVECEGKEIIKGISLQIKKGELHILLGPNGSGKTTLANAIIGLPNCKIKKGKILFCKKEVQNLKPEKRSKLGIAVTFQHPPAIKGVKLFQLFDKVSKNKTYKKIIPEHLLEREMNVGFSGGEKKLSELAQVVSLNPKFIIFDEVDSGTDVKNLQMIAKTIKKWLTKKRCALIITHQGTILKFLKPTFVHVLYDGKIVCSSKNWRKVWNTITRHGYEKCKKCRI